MRFLSIVVFLTWPTIFVPASVYAQNAMAADTPASSTEDAKGSPDAQRDKPPQEQPNTQPVDTTGQRETDSDDARPRTRDDVIREILSGYSPDKHRPVLPR